MEKKTFAKQVVFSVVAILVLAAVCIWFSYRFGLYQYASPTDEITSVASGTVKRVYQSHTKTDHNLYIKMSTGEKLILAYGFNMSTFRNETGYDLEQLQALLEGNDITYLRMDRIPWIVKTYIGDTVIDNTKLTNQDLIGSRWGGVILSSILLIVAIVWDVYYFRKKYAKIEDKRRKKETRRMKLAQQRRK